MTKNNIIKKGGSGLLMLVVACFVVVGCSKEDLSECSLSYITFRQTINSSNADKFESVVHKLNLFVFDANGLFVGEYQAEGAPFKKGFRMELDLAPGTYDLYAWGNVDSHYALKPLTVGTSTYADAELNVVRGEDNHVNRMLTPLFHGASLKFTVKSESSNETTIDLMKNVNFIRVVVQGLRTENQTKAHGELMCRITSPNGDYNFDNSLVGNVPLIYIPAYTSTESGIVSDFSTLRLFNGDATILTVHYKGDLVYRKNLPELLLENPEINNQEDIDRIDEFSIVITIDGNTNIVTGVTVNGWMSSGGSSDL